ncbi:hypothetical protein B0H14DRAFT_3546211 [Mycena olivaceomarginata]|nr:hypothetical protein B0H14DRAFT_3546211 [Mycena olivaceomarginata]
MYGVWAEKARALGDSNLGAHEIDSTFFRASPDPKGNIFYQKSDGTPFVATFVAEIRSEAQGTWMAVHPKKFPPTRRLSHHMVLALRCPTGATPEFAPCSKTDSLPVMVSVVKKRPSKQPTPRSRTIAAASRIRPLPPHSPQEDQQGRPGCHIVPPEPTERKIGDKYLPSKLSDHREPYFAHDKAELVQWDYTDKDGKLIAPEELYATLTEGTLVLVVVSLSTYVIRDQKTDSGVSLPDKKIYHVLIDQLRVLDCGDTEPCNPPVPEIPEARVYSPMTPQRRARDDTADIAFHAFGPKLLPSPPKRARRAGARSSTPYLQGKVFGSHRCVHAIVQISVAVEDWV